MKKLPIAARLYLVAIYCAGSACIWFSNHAFLAECATHRWEVLLFVALAIFAGGKKIAIRLRENDEEAGSMTLALGIVIAALLNVGLGTAVYVAVIACCSASLYPKRQPLHQLLFNVTLAGVEAFSGGVVYVLLTRFHPQAHPAVYFAIIAAVTMVYYLANSFGVATIIALCSNSTPLKVWRESFVWAASGYFATASVTALATTVFRSSFAGVAIFVLPVIYLIYQMFATYQSKNQESDKHIKEMKQSEQHLSELYLATIKSLALAIDAKDQYTHQHILRVQRYSVAIAIEMGFTGSDLEAVNTGALLHDIGKLGVPEYVLMKPGRLTQDEFEKIKKHPEIGAAILGPVEFPWPVLPVVRSHHEKWDGTGYPDGLKGEEIALSARILAVADVYDALTSTRSYRTAWTHERAVSVIQKDAGTHFDPVVVEAFVRVIDGVVKEMAEAGEGPLAPKPVDDDSSKDQVRSIADDLGRSSTELFAMYEVTRTLNSSLGSQDTSEYLCRKLQQLYPGALFTITLKDSDGDLTVRSARGVNEEYFLFAKPTHPNSTSSRCAASLETYHGKFDQEDLLLTAVEGIQWVNLNSAVIIPLKFESNGIGLLSCFHPDSNAFSGHDRSVFETVASQASEALYNSLLFDKIRTEETHDPLTKLFNIRHLTQCIANRAHPSIAESKLDTFALLCVDIDHFRAINETFGHDRGDTLLQGLASILNSIVHSNDTVVRYGSDEFLILLSNPSQSEINRVIAKIDQSVQLFETGLLHAKFGEIALSVTTGHAVFPRDGEDPQAIVAAVELDLRRHKSEKTLGVLSQANSGPSKKAA